MKRKGRYILYFEILAVLFLLILSSSVQITSKEINSNYDLPLTSLPSSRVDRYDSITYYTINQDIDLHGQTLQLPENSVLNLINGIISNGIIIGDSTKIINKHFPVFDKILLDGSWKITEIKTDLFKTIDHHTPSNLSTLLSDKEFNVLSINHSLTVPIKAWSSELIIKSNTSVVLNADIYSAPSSLQGGYCMYIKGNNIDIQGNGHYLFGTLATPEQKECSEWLHGLCISKISNNIVIQNINSWLFCGDGFNNSGSNVTMKNLNAKFNGRQGLSIVLGSNIKVQDSSFTHTGFYRISSGKGPGAGIDIEPTGNDKVNGIVIEKCILKNNYKYMQSLRNDLEIYNAIGCDVTVKNCDIGGIYLGDCSNINLYSCTGIQTIYKLNDNIENFRKQNCGDPLIINRLPLEK